MKQDLRRNKNQTLVVCLLGAACVVALIVLIVVACTSANRQSMGGKTFTPPPFETAAVSGVPEVDDALGWSELSGPFGYVARVCGVLCADADGNVAVWFASDADNDVWLKMRLLNSDGEIIGETGIIKPGEYVEKMALEKKAASGDVTILVMGYEPETYYSAGTVRLATTLEVG